MLVFKVNNQTVLNVINSLTIKDESKELLKNVILNYDYSYVNFLYSLFSVYLTSYVRLFSEDCNLNRAEQIEIIDEFKKFSYNVNQNNVFVADLFDVQFGVAPCSHKDYMKYSSYLYEDIFNRIESLTTPEKASEYMEDIFEGLEFITGYIESCVLKVIYKKEEESTPEFIKMHVVVNDNNLLLWIFV